MKKNESNPVDIEKILVAVDGSPNSDRATELAIDIARTYDAELVILHVIEAPRFYLSAPRAYGGPPTSEHLRYAELQAKEMGERLIQMAKSSGVRPRFEILKTKSSTVLAITQNAAAEKADLIVVGTRGLGGFTKLLLGSVSSGVVTHANCSVLIVR